MSMRIAIFASGSGSNAENIIRYFRYSSVISFPIIVSNRPDAFVHMRAKALNVNSITLNKQDFETGEKVLALLNEYAIDAVVLAGFLLKIPKSIIKQFPNRIINIHPALLPKYGGKGMYGERVHRAVQDAGETETGITVHFVNEHYDEGNIIFQAKCRVAPTDSYEDIARKVHTLEYEHFPKVIERLWR